MNILFNPEARLLEEIDFRQRAPLILIFESIGEEKRVDPYTDPYSMGIVGVFKAMEELYRERFTAKESNHLFIYCFSEPLRNAMEHGNKFQQGKRVAVAIWFGEKGVALGFRDEGDFFSKLETKDRYENRKRNPSTRIDGIGGGNGTKGLYAYANSIVVKTSENTLYLNYLFS